MRDVQLGAAPANACLACKQHKRKCDKLLPACDVCTRIGRRCVYENIAMTSEQISGTTPITEEPRRPLLNVPINPLTNLSTPHGLDAFRYDSLRKPSIDIALSLEASRTLADLPQVELAVTRYFSTTHVRMPFMSNARCREQLTAIYTNPQADFILLCLCISLISQEPTLSRHRETMQSSQHVTIKTHVALLEAAGYVTLNFVQARILVCLYEMGHAIYPAASASIASCAQITRFLGLNLKHFQRKLVSENSRARLVAEEEKRTWWAVLNLDRYIKFCTGDKNLVTEESELTDSLPDDDDLWLQDRLPDYQDVPNLQTPADIQVRHYARECQILHIIGRLIPHVFDPSQDIEFRKDEATQLERTLNAFLPLLMVEEEKFGFYCAASGMCSLALFTLYDRALASQMYTDVEREGMSQFLERSSSRIAVFSEHLFGANKNAQRSDSDLYTPFIPYSIYQAALSQYRLWKQTNIMQYKTNMDSMRSILGGFGRRWQVGDIYVDAFDSMTEDWPSLLFFMGGRQLSMKIPHHTPASTND